MWNIKAEGTVGFFHAMVHFIVKENGKPLGDEGLLGHLRAPWCVRAVKSQPSVGSRVNLTVVLI